MTTELHRYGHGATSTRVVVSRAKVEGAVKAIKAARRADRWDVWKRECNRLVVADLMTQQAAARLLQVAQGTSIWEDHYGRQVHSMLAPFLGEPEGEDDVDIDVVDDTPIAPTKPSLVEPKLLVADDTIVETAAPTKPSWPTPRLVKLGADVFHAVMREIDRGEARIVLDGGPLSPSLLSRTRVRPSCAPMTSRSRRRSPMVATIRTQHQRPLFARKPRRSSTIRVPGAHGGTISMT
jgi:hypothetical protein